MRTFTALKPVARAYVSTVIFVGFAAILYSIIALYINPIGPEWLVLAALTLLTGSFTIKVPSITARLTVSETFVFASVLLFGVAAGTLTVVLETLVVALWVKRESRSAYRALFNVAASALSIWLAGTVFFAISGIEPFSNRETPLSVLFGPLAALTTVFFLSNSWLVALAVGLEKSQPPFQIWWKNFTWLSVNYFSGASVAAVIVTYTSKLNAAALVGSLVIIVPLLLVSYLTFRTAMGRVEDSNQHLSELNRLYLSTIETLAMAIDAKDQITHGHIRRVQAYAVGLARSIGVTDEKLIKAIEAAALLHDMGKLAVPEYILNKPGKLTPAEFEKMKLHASVGADILSAIAFPYPVVPIVRHHHENWDGSGYPQQLKGTDIPIGARILSVVDCFDALTSDRPYRPRLSNDDALAVLKQRRGSMYDPLIVDMFVRVHQDIAPDPLASGVQRLALREITESTEAASSIALANPRLDEITASADEMLTLYELSRSLAGQASVTDTGDVIGKHLRRLIPSSLLVFYLYNSDRDELDAEHAMGDASSVVKGIRIPRGQRLSGWVAANRQTIANSDPMLDLGDVARSISPRLRSCLSTPLVADDELIGVLTLYSAVIDGFSEDHRRIVELIAREIARTFKRASEFDKSTRRDLITGLPNLKQLRDFVESARLNRVGDDSTSTLLFIDIVGLKQINSTHGRQVGDDALRHVVQRARTALRLADILFRYESDELVAVINDSNAEIAEAMALRIRESVRLNPLLLRDGTAVDVRVEVATLNPRQNGEALADLIAKARPTNPPNSNKHRGSTVH